MPNRVQTLRSSTPGQRPASGTREPGELYVNFPDRQIGVVDPAKIAVDLVPVRYFSNASNYLTGAHVWLSGQLYKAIADVTAGAFNASQWTKIVDAASLGSFLLQNDGAGSGLDADLLDGLDSTYFAADADLIAAENRITATETKNTAQDGRLTAIESLNTTQDGRLTAIESKNTTQDSNISALVTEQGTQNTRLTNIETKNTSQDAAIAAKIGDAPADGQTYGRKNNIWVDATEEAPSDSITYGRKNGAWVASIGGATVNELPPSPPLVPGQLWYENDTGNTYVWYDDGSGQQWVQVSGPASVSLPDYVRRVGDLMTGPLTLSGAPTNALEAATKAYVDGADSDKVSLAGDTMTGNLGILSTDSGAATGPYLTLQRDSASPAVNDGLGAIWFYGKNASGASKNYVDIYATILDPVAGSEDGGLVFETMGAGAPGPRLSLDSAGAYVTGNVINTSGNFGTTWTQAVLGTGSAGTVYLRPNGWANASGQCYAASNGNFTAANGLYTNTMGHPAMYIATDYFHTFTGIYYLQLVGSTGTLNFILNSAIRVQWRISDGAQIQYGPAYKPGGGPWTDSSDIRIKNVLGDYESGLDQITALRPVRYTFKGNDTSEEPSAEENVAPLPDDPPRDKSAAKTPEVPYKNSLHYQDAVDQKQYVGLIAQEAETVMPEIVTTREGYIDGEKVSDLRDLDTTNLIFALINAIKELAARVSELEAR